MSIDFLGDGIEMEREGRYLQEKCRCAAAFSRKPCALLFSSSTNSRLGILTLLCRLVLGLVAGGCAVVGWGAAMRNKGLNAGGAVISPNLTQGSGQGREPRGERGGTSADRHSIFDIVMKIYFTIYVKDG
jgi:hypothetical protein